MQTDRGKTWSEGWREREEKRKKQRCAASGHMTGILFVRPIIPQHTDNAPETVCVITHFMSNLQFNKVFDITRNVQFRSLPSCLTDLAKELFEVSEILSGKG